MSRRFVHRFAGAHGLAALTAAALLAVAIWGGTLAAGAATNAIASQSPSAILASATSAINSVSTVRVAGSGLSGDTSISLDVHLVSGRGGEGTVGLNGLTFQFVVIGSEAYFKADAAFWKRFANQAVAQLAAGRWFKARTTGDYASLAKFGSLHALFGALLSAHGTLSKGALTTIRGQKVVPLTDQPSGGTLYVAATGKPYPVEIANAHARGVIVIDSINQPVTLTAPAGAIDISQLQQG
jgi:hypothetical protein